MLLLDLPDDLLGHISLFLPQDYSKISLRNNLNTIDAVCIFNQVLPLVNKRFYGIYNNYKRNFVMTQVVTATSTPSTAKITSKQILQALTAYVLSIIFLNSHALLYQLFSP